MKNTQLLINQSHDNHLSKILALFEGADEIWLATAFLKSSGLNMLLPLIKKHLSKGGIIKLIAGKNFALTEPDALTDLHKLFKGRLNAMLYLDKAKVRSRVFHPKFFLFKKGNDITVIAGSVNITRGGLCDNEEFSICFETSATGDTFGSLKEYFDRLTADENSDVVTLMIIERYRRYFNEQKEIRKQQRAVPEKSSGAYGFDYSKLKGRLKNYDLTAFKIEAKKRKKDYRIAKVLLDEIATAPRLSQSRFIEIIDLLVGKVKQPPLWKSGGLARHKGRLYNHRNEFRELVRFIKAYQKQAPGKLFIGAKKYVNAIYGARMNFVAEIMMTYQPERFANLNSNPITVLEEEAGVYFKSHSDYYNEDDYHSYCEIIKEICSELKLKNMLEADSFINDVYWDLKEESTK